jgi:hypothetical protein
MASLSEELLLLALDDEKGTVGINASATLDTALAGLQLMDLVLARRLTLEDGRLVVTDPSPTGDPVLDLALSRIAGDDKRRKPASWIPKLTGGLRKRLLAELVLEGTVSTSDGKVLGLIPRTRHPARDPKVEREVRDRLRTALLDAARADERTAALAMVIQAADLEPLILARHERKVAKARLKQLAADQAITPAIAGAVRSVNAATMAAIAAATAASAAATAG